MSRNNADRIGSFTPNADPPVVPPMVDNSNTNFQSDPVDATTGPLSYAVPTEIVTIPSLGEHYPEGHPLRGVDEIEIRHMTAKDEDILNSRTFLKKGTAVDRLLQGVIVDKRIKLDSLLVGDKNALIVAARVTGYGEEYNTKITCPSCGSTDDHNFDLDDAVVMNRGDNVQGVTPVGGGVFSLTLPKTGMPVEVRLLTGADEKRLLKMSQKKQAHKLPDSPLTDQFKSFIVSVDGNTDRQDINSFIDIMPALDARHLRTVYAKIMPNIELKHPYDCEGCGYEQVIDIPFTVDFFWPRR
tara:strand:+ start:1308 stop:2201 length:894 start_codon:yes stop_codon:yes gene_type:complete